MPFPAQVLKVLIASPGDTRVYRDAIEGALHEWNGSRSQHTGVILLPRRWETSSVPLAGGDGQSVINRQLVDDADVVFGVFHATLGHATPRAASGTAEELERSQLAGKPVHVYFSTMPIPYDHDRVQLAALDSFKAELARRSLYGSFQSPDDLRNQVKAAIDYDLPNLLTPTERSQSPVEEEKPAAEPEAGGSRKAASTVNAARQELFAEILGELVELDPRLRPPNRGAHNWVTFAPGPFGYWALSVTRTGQLRVEAYLDKGDKDLNKALFEQMYAHRASWEADVGFPVSWERLDDKKASRIAAYSPEAVRLNDPGSRSRARDWAVQSLTSLYIALDEELRKRAQLLKAEAG